MKTNHQVKKLNMSEVTGNSNKLRFEKIFKALFFFLLSVVGLCTSSANGQQLTIDFHQASNENHPANPIAWLNGILSSNNSDYYEGVGVPQRIVLTGIAPTVGNVHTLTFRHQAIKGGIHAYDFLISWTQANQTAANIGNGSVNELQNLFSQQCDQSLSQAGINACTSAIFHSAPNVPDVMGEPSTVTCGGLPPLSVDQSITCFENIYGNRTIDVYGNAAMTSSAITFDGYVENANDSYATYTLTWTSTSSDIVILLAGRLAQSLVGGTSCGYMSGCGAGFITGGPFHFKLEALDGNSLGNQDNQIQSTASTPAVVSPNVNIYITANGALCNSVKSYFVVFYYEGPTPVSGAIQYVHSSSMLYQNATISPSSNSGDTITWNYSNLISGQYEIITVNFLLPGAGNNISSQVSAVVMDQLNNVVDSSGYSYPQLVTCSFDPNDKSVNPPGETAQHYTPMNSSLDYTIRFQNTGNAPATRVEIVDTLSNHLDLNSLRIIGTSHAMSLSIENRTLHFVFDNILLPDSNENEPASHGHIFYTIKPLNNLPEMTAIKNTAHIFFDLNAPVGTNTTLNTLTNFPASAICTSGNNSTQKIKVCHGKKTICVDINAVNSHLAHGDYIGSCTSNREEDLGNADEENELHVHLFPNPTSGDFTLSLTSEANSKIEIQIFNSMGQQIYSESEAIEPGNFSKHLSLSQYHDGLYYLRLLVNGRSYSLRLIKKS